MQLQVMYLCDSPACPRSPSDGQRCLHEIYSDRGRFCTDPDMHYSGVHNLIMELENDKLSRVIDELATNLKALNEH